MFRKKNILLTFYSSFIKDLSKIAAKVFKWVVLLKCGMQEISEQLDGHINLDIQLNRDIIYPLFDLTKL